MIIREAPPPPRQEFMVVRPSPRHVWIAGYWRHDGRTYIWMSGHWEQPPREGFFWVAPRWEFRDGGWVFAEGRWDRRR
jgi:WXXGXW repeat (2 copies)